MAGVALREISRQFEIRKIKIEQSEEETSLCDPEVSEDSSSSSPAPLGQEQGTAHSAVVTSRQKGKNSQSYSGEDKTNRLPDNSSMECDINTFAGLSFPQKLWLMVESDQFEMVWWAYGGNCIVIDKEEFEAEVLAMRRPLRAFRTKKMSSIIRQLNLYGFNKIHRACRRPPFVPEFLTKQEALAACRKLLFYSNPYFRRDYPHLLKHCKRRVAPKRGALAAPALQQDLNGRHQCGSPGARAMQGTAGEPGGSMQAVEEGRQTAAPMGPSPLKRLKKDNI